MSTFQLICADHGKFINTDFEQRKHVSAFWQARDTLLSVFSEASQGRDIARNEYVDMIELEVFVFGIRIRLDLEEFMVEHCNCNVAVGD